MEDKFLHHGNRHIQHSYQAFSSTDQKYMQQQYPANQMYSTYPPQNYRQSFPAYPQITDRENTFSPPPITFPTDQSNTTFQPQNNKTTIKPSSFQFFNQMQRNPIYSKLQDVLAEDCSQSSLPSTLIQTITHDYNNNGYNSASSQQKFQIHKTHSTTQPNYRAYSQILPNSGPSLQNSQYASKSIGVFPASNHVSSGLCNQPFPQQYGPPIVSSSGSTSQTSFSSSESHSRRAPFLINTPDVNVISASSQKQKSPTISPTSSHLSFSGSSASSEQEVDPAINFNSSLSLQVDSGVDILNQASKLSGITAEDADAFIREICSPSDHSVSPNVCPPASVLPTASPSDHSVSSNVCPPASVLHEFDSTRHETAFNSINSSHFSLSDNSPIRGEEIFANTPNEIQQSNPLKRKIEDEESKNFMCMDFTNVLNNWYQSHTQYPYPTDDEVDELVRLSGLTRKQVKKWMANKRVRCFNTLSISGNQHPIKFKRMKREMSALQPMASKSRDILNHWYETHLDNPYPTEQQKEELGMKTGLTTEQVKRWLASKRCRENNTKKQIPNYFIQKFPEYSQHVEMVSKSREFSRMSKRRQLDDVLECLNTLEEDN